MHFTLVWKSSCLASFQFYGLEGLCWRPSQRLDWPSPYQGFCPVRCGMQRIKSPSEIVLPFAPSVETRRKFYSTSCLSTVPLPRHAMARLDSNTAVDLTASSAGPAYHFYASFSGVGRNRRKDVTHGLKSETCRNLNI